MYFNMMTQLHLILSSGADFDEFKENIIFQLLQTKYQRSIEIDKMNSHKLLYMYIFFFL